MIYKIHRTSDFCGHQKPCSKAYEGIYDDTVWYQEWLIDIDTLEHLHELIAEVGRIILQENEIEIYDDFRE